MALSSEDYWFSVRVLVKHPRMTTSDLTASMGELPNHAQEPEGQRSGFWSCVSETSGQRLFFNEVREVIEWLEGRRNQIAQVIGTGGAISVIVQLPGNRNIGDEIGPTDLRRAADLGVSLGVEVFPQVRGITDIQSRS